MSVSITEACEPPVSLRAATSVMTDLHLASWALMAVIQKISSNSVGYAQTFVLLIALASSSCETLPCSVTPKSLSFSNLSHILL